MKKTIHVAIALLAIGTMLVATSKTNAYQSRKRERNSAATAYYNQGVKHVLSGRNEEAVGAFKQAIQLDPEDGDAYFSLGKAYADLGRWSEAVEAYQRAIRLNPKDGEAYNNLGLAYFQLGSYGQALDAFMEAIRIHPRWAEPHYNLSNVYRKLGRNDAADASYRQAILLRPDLAARPPLTAALKGTQTNVPQQSGRDVAARAVDAPESERHATQESKAYSAAPSSNGDVRPEGGRREEKESGERVKGSASPSSVSDVRRTEKGAPPPTSVAPPKASAAERAVRLNPRDSRALYNLGVRHGRAKHYEEAVKAFQQAIQSNPNYADAYFGLGQAYSYLGRWKEAADAYEQVLRLDPKDDEAYQKLGEAYVKSRAPQAAPPKENAGVASPSTGAGTVKQAAAAGSGTAVGERVGATVPEPLTPPTTTPTVPAKETKTAAETEAPTAARRTTPETNAPAMPRVAPVKDNAETKAVAATAPAAAAVDPTSIYRVGVGDVLDVRFLNAPTNESTLFTITAGGLLEYPLAGRTLRVAGLTTDEIAALITSELKHRAINENPQVVVGVREYASHNIIISGLVSDPGTKVLRREAVPLYVVVADAQPRAEAGQVIVISRATGQRTTVDLSDQAAMSSLVYPGDVLTVETRAPQFFYIGGQVNSPGQKNFQRGMTLTQAILTSGGELTRIGRVKIMRQDANGRLTTVSHNLREILSGKAPDPVLQPNDRIGVAP